MKRENLIEGVVALIEKCIGPEVTLPSEPMLKCPNSTEEIQTLKALDEDKRLFTAIVLKAETTDSQGEIYSADVVEKACHDYNEFCSQGNIQHLMQTDLAVPVESWIAKSDMVIGNGEVNEGDWVMTMKIKDDQLWEMCLDGTFTGFSIGCKALVETLGEDE